MKGVRFKLETMDRKETTNMTRKSCKNLIKESIKITNPTINID